MTKQISLTLVIPALWIACTANADVTDRKTDAVSELQKSFYKTERDADAQRIGGLEDATGREWIEMGIPERMDYITASMNTLSRQGVPMRCSMNDYYNAVTEKLRNTPDSFNAGITDILASVLYEKEPASREALDKYMKQKNSK